MRHAFATIMGEESLKEMLLVVLLSAIFFAFLLATVFIVLQKIHTGNSVTDDDVRQEFSIERYRPMFRLIDDSDFELSDSSVSGPSQLRRFRAERRSLFRVYLRDLGADHARIVGSMRKLLVESNLDRPVLARALYRCQFMFALATASIEFKLSWQALGIGTVDLQPLFSAVECLQLQLSDMRFVQAVSQ
jgi:hypothetical protein